MKCYKTLLMGAAFGLCLVSCVSEELPTDVAEVSGKGSMTLDVDLLSPSTTRAVETKDFPVKVINATDGKVVKSYERAAEVPNQITLPVGDYYAEAHTPGELKKIMTSPYYKGKDEFEILKGVNTKSKVTCRMANGSFKVNYSSDFSSTFTDWTISIDDGGESVIQFTQDDGLTPAIIYMAFEESVDKLTVNFKGTTASGNKISTANTLTKKHASEQYDSDTEDFSGGDAIVINFSPTESTEGNITGVTLTATISFEESSESFWMEVEDKETSGGGNTGGGNTGEETSSITLDLPENMTIDGTTDPSLGDTYIEAQSGIKSITVSMSSTSPEMIASLQDLSANYDGVDFLSGTEIVGNQEVVRLFSDLGQSLSVPSEGDTTYTFPIGNFFTLLMFLPGEHSFGLTVTDMDGNTRSGSLTITVE